MWANEKAAASLEAHTQMTMLEDVSHDHEKKLAVTLSPTLLLMTTQTATSFPRHPGFISNGCEQANEQVIQSLYPWHTFYLFQWKEAHILSAENSSWMILMLGAWSWNSWMDMKAQKFKCLHSLSQVLKDLGRAHANFYRMYAYRKRLGTTCSLKVRAGKQDL